MPLTYVMQLPGEITDVTTIAERLKAAREALDLSQVELAKASGVKPGTIGNIEAGTRKNPRHLLEIAAALKVRPLWLKTGKGPKEADGETTTPTVVEPETDISDPIRAVAKLMPFLTPADQQLVLQRVMALMPSHVEPPGAAPNDEPG